METKDWIGIALTVWSNLIATAALIVSIRQGKKKTASKSKGKRKHKR